MDIREAKPLLQNLPPLLNKERGTQGVRSPNKTCRELKG